MPTGALTQGVDSVMPEATVSRAVAMKRREEWPRTRAAGASPMPTSPSSVSSQMMRL